METTMKDSSKKESFTEKGNKLEQPMAKENRAHG
jgi:hypothetical protein